MIREEEEELKGSVAEEELYYLLILEDFLSLQGYYLYFVHIV